MLSVYRGNDIFILCLEHFTHVDVAQMVNVYPWAMTANAAKVRIAHPISIVTWVSAVTSKRLVRPVSTEMSVAARLLASLTTRVLSQASAKST